MVEPVDPALLPSVRSLKLASVGGLLLVGVLAITVVLPAERGVDPTGVGAALGLTQLAAVKAAESAPPPAPADFVFRTDELTIELGPREGLEVKVTMREGDELVYGWSTGGGSVFFDFHGEPEGGADGEFTSYGKGQAKEFEGLLQAPFDGVHGWYWKNLRSAPTTVTLTTTGVYTDLRELD